MSKMTKKQRHGMGAKQGPDARRTTHPRKKERKERAMARQQIEAQRPANDPRRKRVRRAALAACKGE